MKKKELIKLIKSYRCGKHIKLLKAIAEIGICGCVCHGNKYVNDCHYIHNDRCETCHSPSAPNKKCNSDHCK